MDVYDYKSDESDRTPKKLKRIATRRKDPPIKGSKKLSSAAPVPTQRASSKGTPKTKVLQLCLPKKSLPERTVTDDFAVAKERLHVSCSLQSLPCRESEFANVLTFVECRIHSQTGGCMYISGVPGTGKTATVKQAISQLQQAVEGGELPEFNFVEINGFKLTDPKQAYVSILKQLTEQDATVEHAVSLLEKYFSTKGKKSSTVLLVDELDLLWTQKQQVLYHLFDWPTKPNAQLIILAIANTMDFPERVMMNKISSRLGLTRLAFQPYTFQQLQEIISSRVQDLRLFEPDAVQFVARKVAAVSGDARRALDICLRATELAQAEKEGRGMVGMVHVNGALQEMFSSPKIMAMKLCSSYEKFFLKSLVAEFRRTGVEESSFKNVYEQLDGLLRVLGKEVISVAVAMQLAYQLGSMRLVLLQPGKIDILRKIRLNVSTEDVIFALDESV
eukprot:Em0009g619a